ncbi:urease accessory protein UreF [Grimontia hollisae]|uniref:Urease accessory protein UreF n=1 Tax=Grimontia hollisae CIP 101886 TaxID=675812 RepID=D0I5R4_GRIHO|nr:urease accessory UreF family protein [Grimontia hollisae]AMG29165.1 urease accessory protein UreF [Grimontia hollisae]EEY73228.1 urease accessory protein UreF [Grimontia hollisae CIP 101886]STO76762.1 Urease accessory protein UreF [Grimontia hollisae]
MAAEYRLFQLISPSLPVGAFSYSQGLEWAIETGWVDSESTLKAWLVSLATDSLQQLELPVLRRVYAALKAGDIADARHWCDWLYASRETKELRREEHQRGRTMLKLIQQLTAVGADTVIGIKNVAGENAELDSVLATSQVAGFALAGVTWEIEEETLCHGYAWSWLENCVMAGVKMVPLGQTTGQRVLMAVSDILQDVVEASRFVADEQVGSFAPAQAIASSCHETQYSRLFRS